ncbi:MAG: HEAT repeat domain-containing protein [Myxococcota bacterium]
MRKLIVTSLFSALVFTSACKEPDPNRFETHVERIKSAESRSQGFSGLEKLTKTVLDAQDNKDLLDEFSSKVIPAFEAIYADAEEQQEKMLMLLRDVGRPEGAPVWNMALELDGSSTGRKKVTIALDGIKKAKADGSVEKMVELFEAIIAKPSLDDSETDRGKVRLMLAETMGEIGDKRAVPVLIKAMEQTTEVQPVAVHRAAAKALGRIGDPSAVDALLTVTFRVPDAPTTTNIGVRSKQALASIGEPAVPKVLEMLRGDHTAVQELAAKNGVPQPVIQQTAAGILGAMGVTSAVDDLVGFMPTDDCQPPDPKKKKKDDEEPDAEAAAAAGLRAVIGNALGFIGDEKASEAICTCALTSDNPGDKFPLMEALGRIGGAKAVSCLNDVIKTGVYDTEIVRKEFKLEPRWDGARFAILAATSAEIGSVKEAMAAASADATVAKEMKAWEAGVAVLESCKEDAGCYQKTLDDVNADWFAREKAAFELARLKKGDVATAESISKAFKVRNPDARVSMAWLPMHMLEPGTKCGACVEAIQGVIDAEKSSMDAKYQASVLRARETMAALRPTGASSAPAAK